MLSVPATSVVRVIAGAGDEVPTRFVEAVRVEWRRTSRFPFETLSTVGINFLLVIVGWFFAPDWLVEQLFAVHRPLAFSIVLAGWMYADVPTTNVVGSNADRVVPMLDDAPALRQLFDARAFVLWSVVTPIAAIAAVISGIVTDHLVAALVGLVWIVVAPAGLLMIGPLLGILFPYHPMPLRTRWELRHAFRQQILRWILLLVVPYVWVPAIGIVLMVPTLLIWHVTSGTELFAGGTFPHLGLGLVVGVGMDLVGAVLGRRWVVALVRRRRERLAAFLSDPLAG